MVSVYPGGSSQYRKGEGCYYSPFGENNNSLAGARACGAWVESQLEDFIACVVVGPEVGGGGRTENWYARGDAEDGGANLCQGLR